MMDTKSRSDCRDFERKIMEKEYVGIAGEYAVATELCRQNMYAQLTFGTRKRTDILVDGKAGMIRIEVKAKQGPSWPNCKGIHGQNIALVFVDFKDKEDERPDFYVLTVQDWWNVVNEACKDKLALDDNAKDKIAIDDENVPVWKNQLLKSGQPYKGMGLSVGQVVAYKECWDKISSMIGGS